MVSLVCGSVVVFCLLYVSKLTVSAPAVKADEFNFVDDWDFHIEPHNSPLLNASAKNISTVDYEYVTDLKLSPLENINKTVQTLTVRVPKKTGDLIRTKVSCGVCKLGVGLLHTEILNGANFTEIKTKFVSLCVAFKIESEKVCTGFFNVFGPEVVPAYNASNLEPAQACALIFGETCGEVKNENHEWETKLPKISRLRSISNPIHKTGLPVYKVLHLSDTHFDPEYRSGTPANCEEPLCCRLYSTPSTKEPNILSGRWGAYQKCDSPKILIENMLKNIALQHPDIDYIIWTGDLPPHDIWNQTRESNMEIIIETVNQVLKYFPQVPVFPAIGNHESVPAGSFAPPWMKEEDHSIDWLYETVSQLWQGWLPFNLVNNTVRHGGFYSVLLRPGFRLISLNTNYCHVLSWWLLVNSTDPAQELKWLIHELQRAEDSNEKVHIIGHIPPGHEDCMKTWSKNFYSIVERYQNTIVAQFYGHTHADEFELFYETKEYSEPINIAYLAPSITTYENFNPAYRIYYVDGDHQNTTREILDHETWTMDLAKANEGDNEPLWYKLYSAKVTYAMNSLKPKEWNKLLQNMIDNQDIFDLFYRLYYRNSPLTPSCDIQCKIQILCDLKSGRSHDRHHLCNELLYVIF